MAAATAEEEEEEAMVMVEEEKEEAKVCGASVCARIYTCVAEAGGSYVRLHACVSIAYPYIRTYGPAGPPSQGDSLRSWRSVLNHYALANHRRNVRHTSGQIIVVLS